MRSFDVITFLWMCFALIGSLNYTDYYQNERSSGIWSAWLEAQPDIITPPQYFVCAVSLRQMTWKKNIQNCGCPQCYYCSNTFYTMVNAVKVTFCHYRDWNKQIQKIFESSTANSGAWRDFKCPRGMYASKGAMKFGFEQETDTGCNSIQLFCENPDMTQNQIVQDAYAGTLTKFSSNKYGSYMAGIAVKFQNNSKVTGLRFGFYGMAAVWKIVFEYGAASSSITKQQFRKSQVFNTQSSNILKTIEIDDEYLLQKIWINELSYTQDYEIKNNSIIQQLSVIDGILTTDTKPLILARNFKFGQPIQNSTKVSQRLCLQLSQCKGVKVTTSLLIKREISAYTVTQFYRNILTGEDMGSSLRLKGTLTATSLDNVQSQPVYSTIEGCQVDSGAANAGV